MLQNVQYGDHVTIHKALKEAPIAVGKCLERLATGVRIGASGSNAGVYLFSGKRRGAKNYPRFAKPLMEAAVEATRNQIAQNEERVREERYAAQQAAAKAEYDALPESVKLARELQFFCDNTSSEVLAQAPIQHLRALVQWSKKALREREIH